jgi:hypothetical protein
LALVLRSAAEAEAECAAVEAEVAFMEAAAAVE